MSGVQSPWEILGVSRDATQEEIKDQWRRLCKQHHPDLQPEHLRKQAEQYFKEISGAYRTLSQRYSSLSAYAEYTAAHAAAAAARGGRPYASGFHEAWAAGGSQARFSNGVVAAVLFIPLVITLCSGMWMAMTFAEDENDHWRPHGLMSPPENPFLKEDLKPRVHSHLTRWIEKRQAAEAAAAAATAAAEAERQRRPVGAAAGALPAAAAAAVAHSVR